MTIKQHWCCCKSFSSLKTIFPKLHSVFTSQEQLLYNPSSLQCMPETQEHLLYLGTIWGRTTFGQVCLTSASFSCFHIFVFSPAGTCAASEELKSICLINYMQACQRWHTETRTIPRKATYLVEVLIPTLLQSPPLRRTVQFLVQIRTPAVRLQLEPRAPALVLLSSTQALWGVFSRCWHNS